LRLLGFVAKPLKTKPAEGFSSGRNALLRV